MTSLSLISLKDDFKNTAAKIAEGFAKPVTTISTICVKCGDFIRLTLSVLRISDEKVMSIDKMQPSLVDVGSDLGEANRLTELQNELRAKLETKQASIEELLTKADKLVAEQPENQAVVYEAMAESLGATWKDLNDQLNLRDDLLKNAVKFYTSASRHQDQLNIMESFLQATRNQDNAGLLKDATVKHKEINNGILETAVETMTFGDKSIEQIRKMGSKTENIENARDVVRACMKIEAVMLTLNDRRKELETSWEEKKDGLEWSKQASHIFEDLQKIEEWVRRRTDDLRKRDLGDSEHTTEILIREHEVIIQECKEMVRVANHLRPLNQQILEAGYKDGSELSQRCERVRGQMDDLLHMLDNRRQLLQMTLSFFRSANLALIHLDSISNEVKLIALSKEKQTILKQYAELSNRIRSSAMPIISEGQVLLDKIGRGTEESSGIEMKLRELEHKYEQLLAMCSVTKQQAILKSQAQLDLSNRFNSLNSWLTNVGEAALYSMRDMGINTPTADDFSERHRSLANDVRSKSNEFDTFFTEIMTVADDQQMDGVRIQSKDLKTRWQRFQRVVHQRVALGEIYYEFHRKAQQLNTDLDNIDALLRSLRDPEDRSRFNFDARWSQASGDFQILKRQGENFATSSRKLSEDTYLNSGAAQACVEKILEQLASRQVSIGRSWAELQAKAKQDRELGQYWDNFVAECEKSINHGIELKRTFSLVFRNFEERPPSRVALRQQTTLDELKINFKNFEQKVESLLKTAETTPVPADKRSRKEDLVARLLDSLRNAQILNAHYEVLTGMTVTFFRNLQKIDDWIEKNKQKFVSDNLARFEADGRIDQMFQEHKAASQTVEQFIKFARNETEQILNQAKQTDIPDSARRECEKLPSLVQERVSTWNDICKSQSALFQQYDVISKFEREITEILETIETLTRHVREMKQNITLSQQAHQVAYNDYKTIETKIDVTDQRVATVLTTADSYLAGPYVGNRKLRETADSLSRTWTTFKRELEDFRQKLAAAEKYWNLSEESESWIRESTGYIVDTGRKTKELTTSKDADELQMQIDTFIKPKTIQQEERLKKIEHFAHVLYGEEAEHKVERHKRRYKEIVDSFHVIGTQLKTLKETLISSEEAVMKEIRELRASPKVAAPKFVETLNDGQVTEGSRFEFICQVEGKPAPEVRWYKAGLPISEADYRTAFSNGVCTLKIEETMTDDTAVYVCKAFNPYGSAESTARLTVKESPFLHMKAPVFTKRLENATVTESDSHVFECVVQGHPPPIVSWYKNEHCIDRLAEYHASTDINGVSRLRVYKSSQDDNAVFKCRAVNPAGECSTSAYLTVTVTHRPPKIIQPLSNVVTMEGSRVGFEATVTGEPIPDVMWFKDGLPLSKDPHCRILKDSFGCHRLVIDDSSVNQSGQYAIKATNIAGEARSEATLQISPKPPPKLHNKVETEEFFECYTDSRSIDQARVVPVQRTQLSDRQVEEERYSSDQRICELNGYAESKYVAPHFAKTVVSVVAEEGSEVKFDGIVTGSPEPEVSWTKNGQVLSPRDYKQSYFDGHTSLTIPCVTLDHTGKYVCSAKNAGGLATSSAQLVVTVTKEAPDFVERLISQEVEEGGPLRWQVKVSGQPPPKISWLKNDDPLAHSHEYQTVNLGNNAYALYIPHCRLTDAGQFTCRAENDAGEARSSADLVVRRHGDPAKSYVHVTRVYTQEHGKDATSNRARFGPMPFRSDQSRDAAAARPIT